MPFNKGIVVQGRCYPHNEEGEVEMVHPTDLQEEMEVDNTNRAKSYMLNSDEENTFLQMDNRSLIVKFDEVYDPEIKENLHIKRLRDIVDTWSVTSISIHSHVCSAEGSDSNEFFGDNKKSSLHFSEVLASEIGHGNLARERVERTPTEGPVYLTHEEVYEVIKNYSFPSRFYWGVNDFDRSTLELLDMEDSHTFCNCKVEENATRQLSPVTVFRPYDHNYSFYHFGHCGSSAMEKLKYNSQTKILEKFENVITTLCFAEGPGKSEVAEPDVSRVWEMLKNKTLAC